MELIWQTSTKNQPTDFFSVQNHNLSTLRSTIKEHMAHQNIEVNLPLSKVYECLNSPTDFPRFMRGVEKVNKINSQTFEFVTTIGGDAFKWTTNIIDDLRNTRFAWITINGNLNQTGTIRFTPLDNGTRTRIDFSLDYRTFFGEANEELKTFIDNTEEQLLKDLEYFKECVENGTFGEKEAAVKEEQAAV